MDNSCIAQIHKVTIFKNKFHTFVCHIIESWIWSYTRVGSGHLSNIEWTNRQ